MAEGLLLMLGNVEVALFDFDGLRYEFYREDLLPYTMRGKLRVFPTFTNESAKYQATQMTAITNKNNEALVTWLAGRTLLLSRKNAKWLYNLIKVSQSQDERTRAKIALMCRAASILDNYWVKLENDSITWDQVNLRHNPLNEVVAQVALHGKSLTLEGSLTTPEFTTNGTYAKGWRRYPDGTLWLHKLGADGNTEARIEIMCSNLLDKMNVEHVHYQEAEDEGVFVCACPSMTSDTLSILSGQDFDSYCTVHGKDTDTELMRLDSIAIHKMAIVDYLISNRDRHGQNWGLYLDADTTKILRCHPLFDHNNAFDLKTMQDKDASYVFSKKERTIRSAALEGMRKVDFHFTAPIERSDFITQRQYDSFMSRADELGIETIIGKPDAWKQYVSKFNIKDEDAELKRLSAAYNTKSTEEIKRHITEDFL